MEHLQIMGKPMENMNDFWENQGKIYSKYGEITRESMENQDPCFLANGRLADLIMVSWTKKRKGIDSSRKQLWKMDTLWKHNIGLTNKIWGYSGRQWGCNML